MKTRIVGARLIDGITTHAWADSIVEIEDGEITRVAVSSKENEVDDASVIDARGLTLMPGFIDGHVHLLFDPDVPDQESLDRDFARKDDGTLILQGLSAAMRLLSGGVTTARDCGGRGFLTCTLRDFIASGAAPGPRILASGPALTSTGGHGYRFGFEADSAVELKKAARTLIRGGVDCIKVMATGGELTLGTNRLEPQFSQEELAVLASDAHRLNRKVTAHALSTAGIRNAVLAGIDSIEHCGWLGPDGSAYDETVVHEMVARGTFVDFTPAAAIRIGEDGRDGWTNLRERMLRVRDIRLPTMVPMWKAGVQFYFGSDAGVPSTHFEDFVLQLEWSVLAAGLPPLVVINAATHTGARALGIDSQVGSIEVGKVADLLLVAGDPLQDIRALRNVRFVYRQGRLVVEDGNVLLPRHSLAYTGVRGGVPAALPSLN